MKEIRFYITETGSVPFEKWITTLDKSIRLKIDKRINRLIDSDNYGDYKKLSDDLYELRFSFGSGYRIYFTELENIIILFICGGDKSTQVKDIEKAKYYLDEWKGRYYD